MTTLNIKSQVNWHLQCMYDEDTFNMLIREINFEYSYVRKLPFRKGNHTSCKIYFRLF